VLINKFINKKILNIVKVTFLFDRVRGFERQELDIIKRDIGLIRKSLKLFRSTQIYEKKDEPLRTKKEIIKTKKPGNLREFFLESNSASFTVVIKLDGKKFLEHTYTRLAEISDFSAVVDAFQDTDTNRYIVNISDIYWKEDFELFIRQTATGVTLNNIYAIWDYLEFGGPLNK